jgi:hypothetical protein
MTNHVGIPLARLIFHAALTDHFVAVTSTLRFSASVLPQPRTLDRGASSATPTLGATVSPYITFR